MARVEKDSSINPNTATLTKKEWGKLPDNALPTAGYLSRIIPGLDVELKRFIGVWEGITKIKSVSGKIQDVNLRIECGTHVSSRNFESNITVVTSSDRIREKWIIEESKNEIELSQILTPPLSVFSSALYLYDEEIGSNENPRIIYYLGNDKDDHNNVLEGIKRPSQLTLFTSSDIGIKSVDNIPPQSDPYQLMTDIRRLLFQIQSGVASPEIRSQITERASSPIYSIGTLSTYQA